ncbi:MAG TPA: hypothetical protein VEA41_20770 [Salinarimonas sp.]|nr:hypothetical protein [Salinarimonas sp.]
MYQPRAKWIEDGDCLHLMWGHIKVGEVSMGGNGSWYGYYKADNSSERFTSLKDFPAIDLAQREVERALARAAEPR